LSSYISFINFHPSCSCEVNSFICV